MNAAGRACPVPVTCSPAAKTRPCTTLNQRGRGGGPRNVTACRHGNQVTAVLPFTRRLRNPPPSSEEQSRP